MVGAALDEQRRGGEKMSSIKKLNNEEKCLLSLYRGLDSRGRNAVMGTARHEREYGGRNYERQGNVVYILPDRTAGARR